MQNTTVSHNMVSNHNDYFIHWNDAVSFRPIHAFPKGRR